MPRAPRPQTPVRIRENTPANYDVRLSTEDADLIESALHRLGVMLSATGKPVMSDPDIAGKYCTLQIGGCQREVFAVMFLDTRHRMLAFEELFYGSIDGAEVHPREVVKRAFHHNAAAVILTHNHPSGNPEPSSADRAVTARLKQALAMLDIRVLDHFVVSGTEAATSMARRGWI
jgi:DNA repair protein RadC